MGKIIFFLLSFFLTLNVNASALDSIFVNNTPAEPVPVQLVQSIPLVVSGPVTVLQGTSPWLTSRNWTLNQTTDSVSVSGTATVIQRLIDISTNVQANTSSTATALTTLNNSVLANGVTLGLINQSVVSNTLSTATAISTNTSAVTSGANGIIAAINNGIASATGNTNSIVSAINANTATTSATAQAIQTNQTNGSQKTQIVDASGTVTTVKDLGIQLTNGDKGIVTNSVIHGLSTGGGGGYVDVKVTPSGALAVEATVASSALPTGAATSANQQTQITQATAAQATASATAASLASIDTKTKRILNVSTVFRVTVGTSATTVIGSNSSRGGLNFTNDGSNTVYCTGNGASVSGTGLAVKPDGTFNMDDFTYFTSALSCSTRTGSTELSGWELSL